VSEGVPTEEQLSPLAKVDILASLSLEEIERLVVLSPSTYLGTGETYALDADHQALLMLATGRVRVHEPNVNGPGLTISMVEAPTIVTQTGFAAWPPRTMVVEALEPSDLRVLQGEAFDDLVRRNPEVGVNTIRLLCERLSTCEDRLSGLVHKEVPARLATLVLRLSGHQGVVIGEDNRIMPTRYTHNQLASMVGSNREALTRALGKLRKAGAVEVRNRRIHVTDADTLERLAEERR
jgi:CRP/FNR family transcriptional regulator, cyclic AMP receptor protein